MSKEVCLLLMQGVVVIALATLVGLGHNSAIQDGMLAVCGSLAGVGLYERVKGKPTDSATK